MLHPLSHIAPLFHFSDLCFFLGADLRLRSFCPRLSHSWGYTHAPTTPGFNVFLIYDIFNL
jgi:hypothetical protein